MSTRLVSLLTVVGSRRIWLCAGVFLLSFVFIPVYPSFAQITVAGELTHEFVVEPGEVYRGAIHLANYGQTAIGVDMALSDYRFFADDVIDYGEPGSVPRSNTSWITIFRPSTLQPGETVIVPFEVKVPDDPLLVGTYWSIILVTPQGELSTEPAEEGLTIRQVMGYGIQIVTHIGDTGIRDIRILDSKLLYEGEGAILRIDLENTGERWLRPEAWTELYDENGAVVGPFESPRKRIYPGCSVRHRFPLAGIPGGKYKALVVFDNGDEYVWGAQYDLEL